MDDFIEPYINKGVLFQAFSASDDGNVIFAIASCHAFAVDTLDKHALGLALHHLKILGFVLQRDLSHHLTAFSFHYLWHLVWHHCRFGAGTH